MEFESGGLSREEIRKKRRQKERKRALLVLGGVAAAVCSAACASVPLTVAPEAVLLSASADDVSFEPQPASMDTAIVAQSNALSTFFFILLPPKFLFAKSPLSLLLHSFDGDTMSVHKL